MDDCDVDADVDVRDPDEKSIMTYVAQFLQYSRDLPVPEEEMQVCIKRKHKQQTTTNNMAARYTAAKMFKCRRSSCSDNKLR